MDTQTLCLNLLRADHEDEIVDMLTRAGYWEGDFWRPLGDIENNLSIAGNQQSNATAALVEKLINSIDSMLVLECMRKGISPESNHAPQTMAKAAEELLGIPNGNIAQLTPSERGLMAERVQLVATGEKKQPSFTVVDQGEGQRPIDFPHTFCSLVKSNKLRIPFVQGKFNMGGCGVLPFCGERNLQLIVSRRHASLCSDQSGSENRGWGWTIVRRTDPDGGRRSSYYEYLAPKGVVLCFEAESIPALPTRDSAYGKQLESGSVIKLYNYKTEFPSSIVFDLNFELSRRLFRLANPIRLYERRDYRGHSKGTILTGMSVRLEDNRAGAIEEGFPDSGVMAVDNVGDIPVQVTAFNRLKGKNYVSPHSTILFTVNGQVHGSLGRSFCSRKAVSLEYLKNDLMVVVDCTSIPARAREDLFMPSRDRLRECAAKDAFETALEAYLGDHDDLHLLNRARREEELRGKLADDRPLSEALKNVINNSPELKTLFQAGVTLPDPDTPGDESDKYEGLRYPTYFRPIGVEDGEPFEVECPVGGNVRARFETDAENEYFTRADDPGELLSIPDDVFKRIRLHNGRASVVFVAPDGAESGNSITVDVSVDDSRRSEPIKNTVTIKFVEPKEPSGGGGDPNPKSGALALPTIVEVEQAEWESAEFDAESGLSMHIDIDGSLLAKVNVDNAHLRRTLERTQQSDRDMIRKQFIYGLVLSAVSLWSEYAEDENRDQVLRTSTRALARVLLPTIHVLGTLESEVAVSVV